MVFCPTSSHPVGWPGSRCLSWLSCKLLLSISATPSPPSLCLTLLSCLILLSFQDLFHSHCVTTDPTGAKSFASLSLSFFFLTLHCSYSRWQGHFLRYSFYLNAQVLPTYLLYSSSLSLRLTSVQPAYLQHEKLRPRSGPRRRRDGYGSKFRAYQRA